MGLSLEFCTRHLKLQFFLKEIHCNIYSVTNSAQQIILFTVETSDKIIY